MNQSPEQHLKKCHSLVQPDPKGIQWTKMGYGRRFDLCEIAGLDTGLASTRWSLIGAYNRSKLRHAADKIVYNAYHVIGFSDLGAESV